jgi:uncharacterized phage protein (TIGR02218 family)
MAFNDAEISTDDGQPVGLYLFEWGATKWAYTSSDRMIEHDDGDGVIQYQPLAISDSGLTQGGSTNNDFMVTVPPNIPLVTRFRATAPSEPIWMTVRRKHTAEDDAPIYWIGTISNIKGVNIAEKEVYGKPLAASFKRTGLRLCWTTGCPHFLYDPGCKVDPLDYEADAEITALTGTTATVEFADPDADFDANWFQGGVISWEASVDGTIERRMIQSNVGGVLKIFGTTDWMEVGLAVKLYPGCVRTAEVCEGKFNNLSNYGGFDFLPTESPFGTQIF